MVKQLDIKIHKTEHSRLTSTDFDNLPFGRVFADHMFELTYKDGKWGNAQIIPYGPIPFSPSLSVFHYGQAIFEGMKANRDVTNNDILMFRPEENGKRLNLSAERMGMPTLPVDQFLEYLEELIRLDQEWVPTTYDSALYIRPVMFASDEFIGVRSSATYKLYLLIGPTGPYYGKPVSVLVEENYVRAFSGGTGDAKAAGNYGATLLPAQLAKKKGFDQILWTDGVEHKYLEEIGTMNVFFIVDGKVWTPSLSGTILPGITRNSVMQLFRDAGCEVIEKRVSIDEIVEAHQKGLLQDAFGVGTAATITHISKLGYKGEIYELPTMEERELSTKIKNELIGIKTGKVADRHGWNHRIKV